MKNLPYWPKPYIQNMALEVFWPAEHEFGVRISPLTFTLQESTEESSEK